MLVAERGKTWLDFETTDNTLWFLRAAVSMWFYAFLFFKSAIWVIKPLLIAAGITIAIFANIFCPNGAVVVLSVSDFPQCCLSLSLSTCLPPSICFVFIVASTHTSFCDRSASDKLLCVVFLALWCSGSPRNCCINLVSMPLTLSPSSLPASLSACLSVCLSHCLSLSLSRSLSYCLISQTAR